MSTQEADDFLLPESDVRAMVRLLAEVARTPGGVMPQKAKLIEGLAELTGTDYWMWNVTRMSDGHPPAAVSMLHNFNEAQLATLIETNFSGQADPINNKLTAFCQDRGHWTRHLNQIVPRGEYIKLPIAEVFREKLGIHGESLFMFYPVPGHEDLVSAVGLHRKVGRPDFTEREARLLHIITSEVRWLHEHGVPEETGSGVHALSPRLQTVLTTLIDGQSAKRIAYHLGISENTVRGYIRDVYRHFGVNSRAQLLRRFMVGDGGDRD